MFRLRTGLLIERFWSRSCFVSLLAIFCFLGAIALCAMDGAAAPVARPAVNDKEFVEFLKSLNREWTAENACGLLEAYLAGHNLTDSQSQKAAAELATWKARAADKLERLGKDWVKPEAVRAAEQESERLISRAEAIAETGNVKDCLGLLKDASKANPNGIRADYLLGMLYSLPYAKLYDTDEAEKHFKAVLLRFPDHPAALNSLAITQVKQGDLAPALNSFKRAGEVSRTCPEVVHNLGRVVYLADDRRLRGDKGTLKRYSDLYSQMIVDRKGPAFENGEGWKHMLPVFGEKERAEVRGDEKIAPPQSPVCLTAMGSGFTIGPEVIMTNRHVVNDEEGGLGLADRVTIVDPFDPSGKRELLGNILAVSRKADLALVRAPGLKSTPLTLRSDTLKLATEIFVLGYPEPGQVGFGLKATRGIISSVPLVGGDARSSLYYYDAATGPGSSGGPVFDLTGGVIAVHVCGTRTKVGLNGGIPATYANAFLQEAEIESPPVPPADANEKRELAQLVETNSKSVVQVRIYYRAGLKTVASAAKGSGSQSYYEDKACPSCKGRGGIACPQKGCIGGAVTVTTYRTEVLGFGELRQEKRVPVQNKERCPNCNGRGFVDCQGCVGGIDRFLNR